MQSVANKPTILSVIMLNVIILSIIMLSVVAAISSSWPNPFKATQA